jgi:hypothetical protein
VFLDPGQGWTWDGTFVAACLTGVISLLSWFFTHRQLSKSSRDHYWLTRYALAMEHLTSERNRVRYAGLLLMRQLRDERGIDVTRAELAEAVVAKFARRVRE